MGKNSHVDLFKDMIPAVDLKLPELWDATTDEGRKEIKNDLWNLNRYISNVKGAPRAVQEHYIEMVNQVYNKNWAQLNHHPKLAWMLLCMCGYGDGKTYFHEYIALKKTKNKKEELLAEFFPNMKIADVETLASITTDKEIKEYCRDLGWDQKQINELKL